MALKCFAIVCSSVGKSKICQLGYKYKVFTIIFIHF